VKGALDVHRELLARDVPHEVVRLRGTTLQQADDLPRALDVAPADCAVVRCYVTTPATAPATGADRLATRSVPAAPRQGFAAVLVQAGVLPDPAALLDALRARTARPATPDEVNAATDFAAALVSPVCLPADVVLLADSALGQREVLYCPVGEGGVVLGIRTRDLLVTTGARTTSLSASPLPTGERAPWADTARVIDLDGHLGSRHDPGRQAG
jgi:prolyl-tRNA editing enzyme YbaK/EbsC (Cys-tRNA(Pro) deacylase)